MRLDEIKQLIPDEIQDIFNDFQLELEGSMGWEAELNHQYGNQAQIKAYWFDEDGRTAAPINQVRRIAREYFLKSGDAYKVDEQEHHSLYQLIIGW